MMQRSNEMMLIFWDRDITEIQELVAQVFGWNLLEGNLNSSSWRSYRGLWLLSSSTDMESSQLAKPPRPFQFKDTWPLNQGSEVRKAPTAIYKCPHFSWAGRWQQGVRLLSTIRSPCSSTNLVKANPEYVISRWKRVMTGDWLPDKRNTKCQVVREASSELASLLLINCLVTITRSRCWPGNPGLCHSVICLPVSAATSDTYRHIYWKLPLAQWLV